MSNIITDLITRIEKRRTETQNPCKSYTSEAAAEKATAKMAKQAGEWFDRNGTSARYVVFYNPQWNMYCGAIDLTELLSRKTIMGGPICLIAHKGWFTF